MIGWMAVRYDFVDRRLAEAWVELSSQRIIMTDDPCNNTVTTALSAKGVYNRQFERSTRSGITEEKQPRKTCSRQDREVWKVIFDEVLY